MIKIAYLECPTGIAGDMCLGALVDVGVPLDYLIAGLAKLGIAEEYHLWAESVQRNGQRATQVHVDLKSDLANKHHPSNHHPSNHHPSDHHHDSDLLASSDHTTAHGHAHAHAHAHTNAHAHAHASPSEADQAPAHHRHSPHSPHHGTRHLPEIEALIQAAGLPPRAAAWSLTIFRKLAAAEGAVHGIPPEQVHFHEVGATDAIVNIVGTCLGLDWLNIDVLHCSPLPTGGGSIRAAHGRLPVPAPAVLQLWAMRQIPIYSNGIDRELVTPTGAAIATTLAIRFGPPPTMTLHKVGLGAGSINLALPNILRLWLGEAPAETPTAAPVLHQAIESASPSVSFPSSGPLAKPASQPTSPYSDQIVLLETQIDDLNPQAIGYIFDALFAVGAVDVFTQGIAMKKSRPGVLLSVLCAPNAVDACEAVMFRETTTLGIRRSHQQRQILRREIQSVPSPYGPIRVKVAWAEGNPVPLNVQPEYEDCASIARQHNLPWLEVNRLAVHSWYSQQSVKTVIRPVV